MYRIEKTIKISSMHSLCLDYDSLCKNKHGHNYAIKIGLKSDTVNHNGMLLDFSHLKRIVEVFDHDNLNELMNVNPTAENMCKYIADMVNQRLALQNQVDNMNAEVEYVKIWETDDSWAEWRNE